MAKANDSTNPVMGITDIAEAIAWQAEHAEQAGAPITGRVVRAQLAILRGSSTLGARMAGWPGLSLEDAMPLRVAGGLHFLHLSGAEPELAGVYSGAVSDQAEVDAVIARTALKFDEELCGWLESPPQTNEAGRSSCVMAGLLWLAGRIGPEFELIEIGASAGINTMLHRYAYNLGGTLAGPPDSPMLLKPDWRGPPPPHADLRIAGVKGCDIAPVDLTDPAQALRLKAYIWADATERMVRMETAIAMARECPPDLVAADALAFVQAQLAQPQPDGRARVLFHSVMWQYLPQLTRAAITEAMEAAGASATAEKPLGWIRVETNRATFRHETLVRYWPGGGEWVQLAESHPHGAWVNWAGE